MQPRLSLITLGVADVARSRAFYERLGFTASGASNPNVTFFQAGSTVLALFGWDSLAHDATVPEQGSGFRGVTLAHNVATKDEVAAVLADAVAAGATLVKPAQDVFWGGHSGYFADPDGHLWEIAWNPFFPLDANGNVTLPA
ncbi:MAG TPA: VOC family protein [Azospirillum sp.]